MNKIKHFFDLLGFIFKFTWQVLREKRTWIAVAFIVWSYFIAWFNSNYYTQSPVKQWQPVIMPRISKKLTVVPVVLAQTVKPTPAQLTEEQIVKKAKWGDELWNIYMLETTRGKNDGCKHEGRRGGFGVMSLGEPACYDTFEIAVQRASYWYDKIRSKEDLATSVCIWNTGTKQPNCMYYQKYLSL
jgi:hypothetical protein